MKHPVFVTIALFAVSVLGAFAGTDLKKIAAPPIPATDAGFYVAAEGGATIAQDYGNKQLNYDLVGGPKVRFHSIKEMGDRVGSVGGLKIGYNFESYDIDGDFRLQPAAELEAFYFGTKIKLNAGNNTTPLWGPGDSTFIADLNSTAFMLNGIARLKTGTIFTPYIGLGIGGEYIQTANISIKHTGPGAPVFASALDDADVVYAAQAVAGFDIEVAKGWDIFTEYKYVAAMNPSFDYNNLARSFAQEGLNVRFNPNFIGQSIVTAGLKYNF